MTTTTRTEYRVVFERAQDGRRTPVNVGAAYSLDMLRVIVEGWTVTGTASGVTRSALGVPGITPGVPGRFIIKSREVTPWTDL